MNTKQPTLSEGHDRYNSSWTTAQFNSRALLASLILSLGVAGCSNRGSAEPTPTTQTPAPKKGDWFCQPAAPGAQEPWECVQDKSLATNPRPDRLPNAKDDSWAPTSRSPIDNNPGAPRPQVDGMDIPLPANPPPPPPNLEDAQPEDGGEAPIQSNDPPTSASTAPDHTAPTSRTTSRSRQAPDYIRLAYQPTAPISILELPATFYAVQLAALSTAQKIEGFIAKHQLKHLTAAKVASGSQVRYVLILGIYESREKAEVAAADTLPAPLADFTPWIRSLGNLQEAMRSANALSTS